MTAHNGRVELAIEENGLITIRDTARREPTGVADIARLEAAGGDIVVGVNEPELVPSAVLDDLSRAREWLAPVYGERVGTAIDELAGGTRPRTVTVEAECGPLVAPLVRLAFGSWMHRWWQAPGRGELPALDVPLLEIELGALAWHLQPCFGGVTEAAELLRPHTRVLGDLVRSARENSVGAAGETAAEVLYDALRSAVDSVDDAAPGFTDLERLVEEIDAQEIRVRAETSHGHEAIAALLGGDALASMVAEVLPSLGRARYLGEADSEEPPATIAAGDDTVDWLQLEPRVLDARENNVTWSVTARGGEWELRARVPAAVTLRPPEAPRIWARAYAPDHPLPLPVAVWALDYRDGHFEGVTRLAPFRAPHTLAIDVYTESQVHPPRLGDERRNLPDERFAIDRLLIGRVADAAVQPNATTDPSYKRPFLAELAAYAAVVAQ
ncbi:hypothetical protein [Actinomadura violacea]|uniref:Uncharacterized protein n=1 Tax=Actinomadura violacea TaxID=2819934 RepID=A0ABS3S3D4_9ACTN|nr:hypothetical protein [Actinomadura violacea]MBO2463507.1 hypothetical protein [Actinomadura violacea]